MTTEKKEYMYECTNGCNIYHATNKSNHHECGACGSIMIEHNEETSQYLEQIAIEREEKAIDAWCNENGYVINS